jgi:hypothetical protein
MLSTYLVNWSGRPIPSAEMMVMRRVAVMMRTVHDAVEVEFIHDICAGLVHYEKSGVFGSVGGLFFFGDFGEKDGQPNTVDFFIPRRALHRSGDVGMVVGQRMKFTDDGFVSDGYPEDLDTDAARGAGKLKIIVRQQE